MNVEAGAEVMNRIAADYFLISGRKRIASKGREESSVITISPTQHKKPSFIRIVI